MTTTIPLHLPAPSTLVAAAQVVSTAVADAARPLTRGAFKQVSPKRAWRRTVVPFVERGMHGWSRWDATALGIDTTVLPALGDAMVYLASASHGHPSAAPYDDPKTGAAQWVEDLTRHGSALSALRDGSLDLTDEQYDARDAAAQEAMLFVACWYAHMWD